MKIYVQKTMLVEAIRKCAAVVESRAILPILQFISIEAVLGDSVHGQGSLAMRAGSLSSQVNVTASCVIEREGAVVLPARKLLQICASLPEEDVQIVVNEDDKTRALILSGKAQYKVMGVTDESFPEYDAPTITNSLTMPTSVFLDCMRDVSFAKSTDESRRQLNGVLLSVRGETLSFVATDSRRLAVTEKPIQQLADATDGKDSICWAGGQDNFEGDVIAPANFITSAMKGLCPDSIMTVSFGEAGSPSIAFAMTDNVTGDTHSITTKAVEGSYPNYKQVIPESPTSDFNVSRRLFLDALIRTSHIMSESGQSANVTVQGGDLTIAISDVSVGDARETIDVDDNYRNEKLETSFNPLFAIEALKAIKTESVNIAFTDANSPILFTNGTGWKMVMMPMRA